MSEPELNAMAVNVAVPDHLQWTGVRRGEEYTLTTITVRLLPDGTLAAKAYGRPTAGGRGGYTSFAISDASEIRELIEAAATETAARWARHRGLS